MYCIVCLVISDVYSHGYMVQPESRNAKNCKCDNRDGQQGQYFCWCKNHRAFGSECYTHKTSTPGACKIKPTTQYESICVTSDTFIDAEETQNIKTPGPIVATYSSGDTITVKWKVEAVHGGKTFQNISENSVRFFENMCIINEKVMFFLFPHTWTNLIGIFSKICFKYF